MLVIFQMRENVSTSVSHPPVRVKQSCRQSVGRKKYRGGCQSNPGKIPVANLWGNGVYHIAESDRDLVQDISVGVGVWVLDTKGPVTKGFTQSCCH